MKAINLKTNPSFTTTDQFRMALFHEAEIPLYARGTNETVTELNFLMAKYEQKEAALSFSSGMGAISATLLSLLKSGDHILLNKTTYSWARKLVTSTLHDFGVTHDFVDEKNLFEIEKYIKPNTKIVYLESPTYFYFEDLQLEPVIKTCKEKGILTVFDNTYLGPGNFKLTTDIDVILHSSTKIISGHSDSLGGVVCSSKKLIHEIFEKGLMIFGAMPSPFNAYLTYRGMMTYEQRTSWIAQEIKTVITFLKNHPKIEKVYFPFDEKNHWKNPYAYFAVGIFSIQLKTNDVKEIEKFCNSLKLIKMAVSYGGIEAVQMPALIFAREGHDLAYPKNLIRFSTGLQKAIDIIEDIENALN